MHRNGRLSIVIVIIVAGAGFAYYQKRQNTLRCQKPHSVNSENLKRRPYTKGGVEQQRINRQEHREGARGAAHAGGTGLGLAALATRQRVDSMVRTAFRAPRQTRAEGGGGGAGAEAAGRLVEIPGLGRDPSRRPAGELARQGERQGDDGGVTRYDNILIR